MTDEYKTISLTGGERQRVGEPCSGMGYYTDKRSKFLAFAHHVSTVEEIKDILARYRKKYFDARHVCYAYMLGPERLEFRANDDGEPSSTAGTSETRRFPPLFSASCSVTATAGSIRT